MRKLSQKQSDYSLLAILRPEDIYLVKASEMDVIMSHRAAAGNRLRTPESLWSSSVIRRDTGYRRLGPLASKHQTQVLRPAR
jgi:hypothetical protein